MDSLLLDSVCQKGLGNLSGFKFGFEELNMKESSSRCLCLISLGHANYIVLFYDDLTVEVVAILRQTFRVNALVAGVYTK